MSDLLGVNGNRPVSLDELQSARVATRLPVFRLAEALSLPPGHLMNQLVGRLPMSAEERRAALSAITAYKRRAAP